MRQLNSSTFCLENKFRYFAQFDIHEKISSRNRACLVCLMGTIEFCFINFFYFLILNKLLLYKFLLIIIAWQTAIHYTGKWFIYIYTFKKLKRIFFFCSYPNH